MAGDSLLGLPTGPLDNIAALLGGTDRCAWLSSVSECASCSYLHMLALPTGPLKSLASSWKPGSLLGTLGAPSY